MGGRGVVAAARVVMMQRHNAGFPTAAAPRTMAAATIASGISHSFCTWPWPKMPLVAGSSSRARTAVMKAVTAAISMASARPGQRRRR